MAGSYRTRLAMPADNFYLRDLLAEILTPPGGVKPAVDEVMANSQAAAFVEGWGRPGDHGVVAESVMEPIGAAWYRIFEESDPAAGFEGGKTPELLVAVDRAHRGGQRLHRAHGAGHERPGRLGVPGLRVHHHTGGKRAAHHARPALLTLSWVLPVVNSAPSSEIATRSTQETRDGGRRCGR
jgi:hypothetical protein